jgi:hypothetical protein
MAQLAATGSSANAIAFLQLGTEQTAFGESNVEACQAGCVTRKARMIRDDGVLVAFAEG